MKVTFGKPDKYGEIQSQSIAIQLTDSPMTLTLNINGIDEKWRFDYSSFWSGIGPKTGEAVNGRITNVSHDWGKPSKGKHLILNVIGNCDNSKRAKLIIWGNPV